MMPLRVVVIGNGPVRATLLPASPCTSGGCLAHYTHLPAPRRLGCAALRVPAAVRIFSDGTSFTRTLPMSPAMNACQPGGMH